MTEVAAPPYDVLNSVEAKKMAGEKSLLHITKPEIDFDPILPDHDDKVYDRAVKNFSPVAEERLAGAGQEALLLCLCPDYGRTYPVRTGVCAIPTTMPEGKIKKHELTRKDKEDDRMVHVKIQMPTSNRYFSPIRITLS